MERGRTILIVEDEKNLGTTLNEYLNSLDFKSFLAEDGSTARKIFKEHRPEIILMDIGLPDINGIQLAKEFKSQSPSTYLLFLSALNDPETKVEGLEIGAEDYITKPFALKELILRLNRIFEREEMSLTHHQNDIQVGSLKISFSRYEIQDEEGESFPLSQKECAILELLYKQKDNVVPRDIIIENIWGKNQYPSNRTVDNYIVKLRKCCESEEKIEILSVRSVGYKLIIKGENDGTL